MLRTTLKLRSNGLNTPNAAHTAVNIAVNTSEKSPIVAFTSNRADGDPHSHIPRSNHILSLGNTWRKKLNLYFNLGVYSWPSR